MPQPKGNLCRQLNRVEIEKEVILNRHRMDLRADGATNDPVGREEGYENPKESGTRLYAN
jgi:hypothetical protein